MAITRMDKEKKTARMASTVSKLEVEDSGGG
jgi:hypothetical protein